MFVRFANMLRITSVFFFFSAAICTAASAKLGKQRIPSASLGEEDGHGVCGTDIKNISSTTNLDLAKHPESVSKLVPYLATTTRNIDLCNHFLCEEMRIEDICIQ